MDALTPAEIFALRRSEQLVALDDLRRVQQLRIAPVVRVEDRFAHTAPARRGRRTAVPSIFPAESVGAVVETAR